MHLIHMVSFVCGWPRKGDGGKGERMIETKEGEGEGGEDDRNQGGGEGGEDD